MGILLERLVRLVALAGGLLLGGIMLMTVASVLGRYLFDAPIPGDYELTELAIGIAVFAFFPYTQSQNANIVVEFFTARLPERAKLALDLLHTVAFTLVAGLIAWRLFVGGAHKLADGETTIFLAIPVHWAYFVACVGALLLAAMCSLVFARHLRTAKS